MTEPAHPRVESDRYRQRMMHRPEWTMIVVGWWPFARKRYVRLCDERVHVDRVSRSVACSNASAACESQRSGFLNSARLVVLRSNPHSG